MSIKIEMNNTVITLDSVAEAIELLNSFNNINDNYNYAITEKSNVDDISKKNKNDVTLIHDIRNEKYYFCYIDTGAIAITKSQYKHLLNDFSINSAYITYHTNDIPDKYKLGILIDI